MTSTVIPMELKTLIDTRYATKSFDSTKKIDAKKIEELKEMIRFAPSSFNIQPWKIKIISDKKIQEQLAAVAWNQPQIASASHLFVFLADKDVVKRIDELEADLIKKGAKKEDIKGYVDLMKGFAAKLTPEQMLAWSQRQVYLALENGLLGAKSLGFDSCPMEGFDPAGAAKILKLSDRYVPTAIMSTGFANDPTPRPKVRFDSKDVFF